MLPFNPMTMIIVGVIAVLLFGERLPEMSKKIGKQFMELRKSWNSIQTEIHSVISGTRSAINSAGSSSYPSGTTTSYEDHEDYDEAIAPKFEPPPDSPAAAAVTAPATEAASEPAPVSPPAREPAGAEVAEASAAAAVAAAP